LASSTFPAFTVHNKVTGNSPVIEWRSSYLATHVAGVTLMLAALALLSRYCGLDMLIAHHLFDAQTHGFPLRTSRLLEVLGHRLVLVLPTGIACVALAGALASYRLPALRPWRGVLWAVVLTCGTGSAAISQLKHLTTSPRPYDLAIFGGAMPFPTHWLAATRAESGGALPSGHTGAGCSLLALYFVGWAMDRPAWRWSGLAIGIAAGSMFSLVRILQGAHFLSQTLWSAVVMWLLASVIFYPLVAWRSARAPGLATPLPPASSIEPAPG
jgi:membrane-associated PAP2 superfamily phosphatase